MRRSTTTAALSAVAVLTLLSVGCTDGDGSNDAEASFEIDGSKARMTGVIDESTPTAVEDLIEDYPEVTTIVMTDVPGSDNDEANLEASSMVRDAGLATHVPTDGFIASGGVDFFLAGQTRSYDPGAQFGVHSWATDDGVNGDELPQDDPEHQLYLDYYSEIGIDEAFYWFTLQAAPPDDFHIMTPEELERFMFSRS